MRLIYAGVSFLAGAAIAAGIAFSSGHSAKAADGLAESDVVRIVEKLLQEKPELVIEAIRTYQAREEAAKAEAQRQQLLSNKDKILNNPNDPFIGAADAKVTMVEFFDYRCGYCKRSLQSVLEVVEANKDVKVVFKEFPILGPESMVATRVSLAVYKVAPAAYQQFHIEAMGYRGQVTEGAMLGLAADAGADPAKVMEAMKDPSIEATIRDNYALAEALNIRGTPAFVIGDTVVPGAAGRERLEALIDAERG